MNGDSRIITPARFLAIPYIMPLLYGLCGCRWGSVVLSVGSLNGSERGHHGILCGGAYLKALLLLLLFSKGSSLFMLLCVLSVSPSSALSTRAFPRTVGCMP